MNKEECTTEIYLKSLELGDIIFEPDGNIPPDFSFNNYLDEYQQLANRQT